MNEQRITDHAEHCDFYVGNEHSDKSYEEQQRLWTLKFAELIVRECMSYMKDGDIDFAKFMIKKHFGVEE